jgi:hypothetical protein
MNVVLRGSFCEDINALITFRKGSSTWLFVEVDKVSGSMTRNL